MRLHAPPRVPDWERIVVLDAAAPFECSAHLNGVVQVESTFDSRRCFRLCLLLRLIELALLHPSRLGEMAWAVVPIRKPAPDICQAGGVRPQLADALAVESLDVIHLDALLRQWLKDPSPGAFMEIKLILNQWQSDLELAAFQPPQTLLATAAAVLRVLGRCPRHLRAPTQFEPERRPH